VAWRREHWVADHALPVGVSARAQLGARVRAGDIIASGAVLGSAVRIAAARKLGLAPDDLAHELRVPVGSEVRARTVLARLGRRFPRTLTAPIDGRLLHATVEGDLYLAPVVDRWAVRATLDGEVTRSDDAVVTIEGDAWGMQGTAAYGPDAIGEIALGVDGPSADLAAARLDVRLAGRIIVGGARVSAEVITRAHACGIAGLVAGAAPAAGLRVVYGDTVTASGAPGREDRPTVLCLMGFGSGVLPREIYEPLAALVGSRAAIHTASARLFVFASADAFDFVSRTPDVALAGDYSAVRCLGERTDAGSVLLDSELETHAVRSGDELVPAANIRSSPER
jgi:hypothetical protein